MATASSPAVEQSATGERWITLLRFYPNGRSLNCRLKLRGSKSWSIELLLRGLTGTVLVGEPRQEETDQEDIAPPIMVAQPRLGFSLMEMLVATAILLVAVGVLTELADVGRRHARGAEDAADRAANLPEPPR